MKKSKIALNWVLVFIWMGAIFYLSSQPDLKISEGTLDFILRKIAHATEFGVLTLLFLRAIKSSIKIALKSSLKISVILAILYAVSDEIHQVFVPTRVGSLRDVIIDCMGVGLVYLLLRRKHERTAI